MLTNKINDILARKEFVYVATTDLDNRPNAAPKLLLKIENNFIYLVDHVIGTTWKNLKVNPATSLTFMDMENLVGYQVNGPVQIIKSGKEYTKIIKELQKKEISFTTTRIIEGVRKQKVHKDFEVALPKQVVIFKVKIEEVVEIKLSGKLIREKS